MQPPETPEHDDPEPAVIEHDTDEADGLPVGEDEVPDVVEGTVTDREAP